MSDPITKPWFWSKLSDARLWHGVHEGSVTAFCKKVVPGPRLTKRSTPDEDERCAKCDRLVWPNGDEMSIEPLSQERGRRIHIRTPLDNDS